MPHSPSCTLEMKLQMQRTSAFEDVNRDFEPWHSPSGVKTWGHQQDLNRHAQESPDEEDRQVNTHRAPVDSKRREDIWNQSRGSFLMQKSSCTTFHASRRSVGCRTLECVHIPCAVCTCVCTYPVLPACEYVCTHPVCGRVRVRVLECGGGFQS